MRYFISSCVFWLSTLTGNDSQAERGVIVVDAGGGTIDLSAYHMLSPQPATFEEIAAAECETLL
jgi:molecular chaperone DnaK (HSP70)